MQQTERELEETHSEARQRAKIATGYVWGPRPALDGLRAIAVYAVVLFHGGIATFTGGFIGVDLFFVLSGFLVTNVILIDFTKHGRLRLARFYARRVRRLFPAAAVAIVGTAATFLLVASPVERLAVIGDARSALLYFANWHFIGRSNDYFAAEGATTSPFLHFWSLSIEEQFYLVFPLMLVGLGLIARRSGWRSTLVVGLLAFGGLSLAAQLFWSLRGNSVHAYYGTDARLYQLLAGAALAASFQRWGAPDRLRRLGRVGAPAAIVAFVLVATSLVDVSPPVRNALAMLTAVAILAALEMNKESLTARGLSRPALTYLGRISYGTYLWHWPVIVAAKRLGDFGPWQLALISFFIGTSLAALSNELVELPVRRSRHLDVMPRIVIAGGLAAGALLAAFLVPQLLRSDYEPVVSRGSDSRVVLKEGQAKRFGVIPDNIDWEAIDKDRGDMGPTCVDAPAESCIMVEGSGAHIHLIGDSHARMLMPTFLRIAREHDLTLSAAPILGCPWQDGLVETFKSEEATTRCLLQKEDQFERVIPELQPDIVFTASASRDDPNLEEFSDSTGTRLRGYEGGEDAFREATNRSVQEILDAGSRLVLLEPSPIAPFQPVECLSTAERVAECAFEATPPPLRTEIVYRYQALTNASVYTVDLDRAVCPHLPICVPMFDGEVAWRDESHIVPDYAEEIHARVFRALDKAGVFEGFDVEESPS
jgi:peptidoglycan/LPS O-acetylase OafA/YrhL